MSPIDDNRAQVELSQVFRTWLLCLRDQKGVVAVTRRIKRLRSGHWGDSKPVGEGVIELRIDTGPGYRLYAMRRGEAWILLLCGGDKDSQRRDIEAAKAMAREYRDAD